MSEYLITIKESGVGGMDLKFIQFWSCGKVMLQLEQGNEGLFEGEPGYIQLSIQDAEKTIEALQFWLNQVERDRVIR